MHIYFGAWKSRARRMIWRKVHQKLSLALVQLYLQYLPSSALNSFFVCPAREEQRCRVSMSALGSAHDSAHGGSRDRETAKDILHEVLHPHTKPSAVAVQYPNNVTCIDNDAAMRTEAEARGHPEISGCIDVGGMCIDVDGIGAVARKICCSTCTAPGAPTQNLPSPSTGPVDIFFLAGQSGCVGLSSVAKLKASGRYSSLEREQPKVWFAGYHGVQSPEMFSISPMSPSALPPPQPPTPLNPSASPYPSPPPGPRCPRVRASHSNAPSDGVPLAPLLTHARERL